MEFAHKAGDVFHQPVKMENMSSASVGLPVSAKIE